MFEYRNNKQEQWFSSFASRMDPIDGSRHVGELENRLPCTFERETDDDECIAGGAHPIIIVCMQQWTHNYNNEFISNLCEPSVWPMLGIRW